MGETVITIFKHIRHLITFPFCMGGLHACEADYVIYNGAWSYASGDYEEAFGYCHNCSRYLKTLYVHTGGLQGHWGRWQIMDQKWAKTIKGGIS